jgi:hypothetical protein
MTKSFKGSDQEMAGILYDLVEVSRKETFD